MSKKPDYYELLGLVRTVSSDEIKKAYRKKAFEFHPDRNPGDHTAEEKFKLVAEAYEALSDERMRQVYDQYGHEGLEGRTGFHGFNRTEDIFSAFSDIFEDFFGFSGGQSAGGARQRQKRGRDQQVDVQIDFLESCFGTEKEVSVTANVKCETCEGSGAKKGSSAVKCSYCNGYGQVQMSQGFFTISTTCPQCQGAGQSIKDKCHDCRGQGVTPKTRKIKVKMPAGIADEMRLVMRGEGEGGQFGGPAGDLYVFVKVKEHPEFKRDGDDIHSEVKVPFPQLALGATIEIETIDGKKDVELRAGAQSGDIIRLKNAGVVNLRSGRRGEHLLRIQAVTPTKLTDAQKKLLEQLAHEFSPSPSVIADDVKDKSKKKKKSFFSFLNPCWG